MIGRFVEANRRLCSRIEDRLPDPFKPSLRRAHRGRVAELLNARPGQIAIEVGAGRESAFWSLLADKTASLIVGMDISEAELRRNRALAAKLVADAAAPSFPLRDNCADLIASHSVVEHLPDNAAFFANCAKALRPGGMMVHTFPCKFAPFALLNQLLPNRLARRFLAWFHPDWRQESVGFPAFYDHCTYSRIRHLLSKNGFQDVTCILCYYQSVYFDFFLPLYLVMLAYDLAVWRLGIRNLACGMVMVARRTVQPSGVDAVDVPSRGPSRHDLQAPRKRRAPAPSRPTAKAENFLK